MCCRRDMKRYEGTAVEKGEENGENEKDDGYV